MKTRENILTQRQQDDNTQFLQDLASYSSCALSINLQHLKIGVTFNQNNTRISLLEILWTFQDNLLELVIDMR